MKHSIYFRNFIMTAAIVLMGFVVLGSLSTVWSYRLVLSERKETMDSTLRETAWFISMRSVESAFDLSAFDLRVWLSMVSGISGFDLLLTDPNGTVVSCSDRELTCPHMGKTVPEQERTQAFSGSETVHITNLDGVYGERRQVAGSPLAVNINGERVVFGYLLMSSDTTAFREAWRSFTGVFTLISVNVMALTFVISFVTTKKQAEPLKEMALAAGRFAHGDFSVRVEDCTRLDEIGQLTQAFNAMADSLESSEKLRREFIANISHELKTPMTVIAGFADGILDGTIPPEHEARYLGVISSETMRLSRLVKGMLDMSKLQSGDESAILQNSFDVAEVVRLALLSLGGKIDGKSLDVEAELPEEPVFTRGDKDSITQVVYNLIDNAIKFSNPGGVIGLCLWKQSGKAFVSVENRGETIPEAELPLIFGRFHKADKARSADRDGVGLGLYIVKTILDNHNEDIYVTSRDGVTRFVFTLTITG